MPDTFDLEKFLPYRLSLLSNRVSGAIADSYRHSHQISISEWRVIAILGQYPHSTATDLQHFTAMDKVNISRSVKRLIKRQLIASENHEHDGRARKLSLTAAGNDLRNEVIPRAQACEQQLTSTLSTDEIKQFSQIIDKLLRSETSNPIV